MSEQKFNELLKRMLDFGHNETKVEEEKDNSTPLIQGEVNHVSLPSLQTPTTQSLPRKERREKERIAARLQKQLKINGRKEEKEKEMKLKLEKIKEETRKSVFSDKDRERIERVLFNTTK